MTDRHDMSNTMRDAFEAWAIKEGYPIGRMQDGETYNDPRVHCGWWSWQAAQSQPAPPVPADVQEITRLIQPYVAACLKFNYTPMELIEQAEADVNEAFKPIEAALIALAEENHRLKFELDGVRAMRGPLTDEQSFKFQHRVLQWNRAQAEPPIRIAYEYNTAAEIAKLYESTHGIEPEQGGNHG